MKERSSTKPNIGAFLQFAGLLVAFLIVILAGYGSFRAFAGVPDLRLFNLYTLAIVAGIASFFSPCVFPLLPSYFSFYHSAQKDNTASSNKIGWVLRLGFAAALGVLTFDLLLGVFIALLGSGIAKGLSISGPEPSQFVRYFRGGVGVLLLILGFGQLFGWNIKPTLIDAFAYRTRPERKRKLSPAKNLYLYGFGYNAAGMGCTGPILAGLMILTLSSGGFGSALTAFVIFSLTMMVLMMIVSGLVSASQQTLISKLKANTVKIKSAASLMLILVGMFNIYSAFDLDLFVQVFFP
jgi:cytochrome c-type biogenesis protein